MTDATFDRPDIVVFPPVIPLATLVIGREWLRYAREGEFVRNLPQGFQWFGAGQGAGQWIVVAIALSYRSATWIVWTIVVTAMLVAFGVNHPPVLDEEVPLDASRKVLAVFALVMFALCFTPVPIQELFTGR